jgi:hypothetical protein
MAGYDAPGAAIPKPTRGALLMELIFVKLAPESVEW